MRNILLFCLSLLSFAVTAQTIVLTGRVTDAVNGDALPMTNIVVLNHSIGTSANIFGFFEIILNEDLIHDTLVFSHVGYQTKKVCISDINNDVIELYPQVLPLREYVVKPHDLKSKSITVNSFRKRDCFVPYSDEPLQTSFWVPYRPKEPTIEAKYFPFKDGYTSVNRIKEVHVYVRSFSLPASFRLRVFNANRSLEPAEDLLTENLIIEVTEKEQLVKTDLEKYNLVISENGIFIGFELLIKPENSTTITTPCGEESVVLYSPFLMYFPTDELNYEYWLYSKGKWQLHSREKSYAKGELFSKPAISLILTN